MGNVVIGEMVARAVRTAALTAAGVAAIQPATAYLFMRMLGSVRTVLPLLAVVAAAVLSLLGQRLRTTGRWPQSLVRGLLALGWLLASAVVVRRLVVVAEINVDVVVLIVGALVLPAKALMRGDGDGRRLDDSYGVMWRSFPRGRFVLR